MCHTVQQIYNTKVEISTQTGRQDSSTVLMDYKTVNTIRRSVAWAWDSVT